MDTPYQLSLLCVCLFQEHLIQAHHGAACWLDRFMTLRHKMNTLLVQSLAHLDGIITSACQERVRLGRSCYLIGGRGCRTQIHRTLACVLVIARVGTGCSCLASSLSALPTELGLADVGLWCRPWPGYAGSAETSAEPRPPSWMQSQQCWEGMLCHRQLGYG